MNDAGLILILDGNEKNK